MPSVGEKIKQYKIIGEVGSGGMGNVYLAFDETLERKVALKSIKKESIDEENKARFLREARILSSLEHPNICTVYDFIEGEKENFIVLELISGKNLKEEISSKITFSRKLDIALEICDVLLKAHSRDIVHRDLKPENIMVNNEGRVKVLDFGLAGISSKVEPVENERREKDLEKQILQSEKETLLIKDSERSSITSHHDSLTTYGTVMGTLSYMSPEQARGINVTTSSDIYSFGIILQEMFTEKSAYPEGLDFKTKFQMARDGKTLEFQLKDKDLQELIERMKSFSPSQRPTAFDVYEKLKWIKDRPKRRLKKTLWASAFSLIFIVLIIISYQSFRIKKEAQKARLEAERANREALTSQRVSDFLIGIFKVSDPYESKGENVTVRELLEEGSKKIMTELKDDPKLCSKMLQTIGEVYTNLGMFDRAETVMKNCLELTEKSYGKESEKYAELLEKMGDIYDYKSELDKAKEMYEESIKIRQKLFGENCAEQGTSLAYLSWIYYEKEDFDKALPLALKSCEILTISSPKKEGLPNALNILAMIYKAKGDFQKAEETYLRTINLLKQNSGENGPDVADVMVNLAVMYRQQNKIDEARKLYESAFKIQEEALGKDHIALAVTLNNIGKLEFSQKNYSKAEEYYKRALEILSKSYPTENLQTATIYYNFALMYEEEKKLNDAKSYYKKAKEIFDRVLGKGNERSKRCEEKFKIID